MRGSVPSCQHSGADRSLKECLGDVTRSEDVRHKHKWATTPQGGSFDTSASFGTYPTTCVYAILSNSCYRAAGRRCAEGPSSAHRGIFGVAGRTNASYAHINAAVTMPTPTTTHHISCGRLSTTPK